MPPNILILFTDMQRADTIHALGNDIIRTSNLDRLTREGTAFTNCFSPSPVCVPARCCFHYGLYPQKTGVFDNAPMMPDNANSLPAVLGRNGYRTHAVGKRHFTPDAHALRGFQTLQSQEECTSNPLEDDYIRWLADNGYDYYEPHGARGEMYYIPQISSLPVEAHPSQWVGSESVRFIREAAGAGQPWCLFSSYIHPHPPFAPPKPWHKLYRAPDMPLPCVPEASHELLTWINRLQNRYKYRDRGIDLNLIRTMKAYYFASISFVDFQIGRILAALEETDQVDHTLIIFTSDHGEYLGDLNCFGKRGMHDASARVPMLVRAAERFTAGLRCSTAVSLVDVFPTALGHVGIDAQGLDLDGMDLSAVAAGEAPDRTVYSQFARGSHAIYMAVSREWKYVYSAGDNKEFFFNRSSDPGETANLAHDPQAGSRKEEMKQDLLRHLRDTGMSDAWVPGNGRLEWLTYPLVDETYLSDPDARLTFQDYPSDNLRLPELLG
jgi:arylsulfatase